MTAQNSQPGSSKVTEETPLLYDTEGQAGEVPSASKKSWLARYAVTMQMTGLFVAVAILLSTYGGEYFWKLVHFLSYKSGFWVIFYPTKR